MTINVGAPYYYKYLDCKQTLEEKEPEDRVKTIYQWIKQGHINLTVFKELIADIEGE